MTSSHYTAPKAISYILLLITPLIFGIALAEENIKEFTPSNKNSSLASLVNKAKPVQGRMLKELHQLSPSVLSTIGITPEEAEDGIEAFGSSGHPFTTQRVSEHNPPSGLYRATGKMFMVKENDVTVCTGSVIDKSLIVTAAHCVHLFGMKDDGYVDSVSFEPARHNGSKPHGSWIAKQWYIPETYFDGTDKCSPDAAGVVCENDIAIIVLDAKNGKYVGDVVGKYGIVTDDEFGFTEFLLKKSSQITQLGYPADEFDGDKMVRTDSLGYLDDFNNIIIGSNQTGGSSGGPLLQNFGFPTSFTGTEANDNQVNLISGVTSWGYGAGKFKAMGASRFSKNSSYKTKSNISTLKEKACSSNPWACEK